MLTVPRRVCRVLSGSRATQSISMLMSMETSRSLGSPFHRSSRMNKSPIALVAAVALLAACSDSPTTPTKVSSLTGPSKLLGNGFPTGGHDYRLNIIGVPKDKTADMTNNNGRRIFVQLESNNVVTTPGGKNNQL